MSARPLRAAATAAAASRAAYAALTARPPGGTKRWTRTNYRGRDVTLLAGPAVAAGGIAGTLAAGRSPRHTAAAVLAAAGAAAFGGYDDLAGDRAATGLRGHLGALAKGELTTGTIKLAGIGTTALAAACMAGPGRGQRRAGTADRLINAGLIAGSANLVNLFDLRPGRAVKVTAAAGALLSAWPGGAAAAAAPLGAAAALAGEDLGERAMLGDAGANALGALLGAAAAATLPRPARILALAAVTGLTAASEVVSFSQVIDATGPLARLDQLGREPDEVR